MFLFIIFFFKHKTAYEMRISDWSSDVCSSDLITTYTDGGGSASILLCRSVPPFAHLYPFRPARPAIHHNSRHVVFARRRQDHICYLPRPIRSAGWGKGHSGRLRSAPPAREPDQPHCRGRGEIGRAAGWERGG